MHVICGSNVSVCGWVGCEGSGRDLPPLVPGNGGRAAAAVLNKQQVGSRLYMAGKWTRQSRRYHCLPSKSQTASSLQRAWEIPARTARRTPSSASAPGNTHTPSSLPGGKHQRPGKSKTAAIHTTRSIAPSRHLQRTNACIGQQEAWAVGSRGEIIPPM